MKQQCDSQNANPRSDSSKSSLSRDSIGGGGGVAKIESDGGSSRSSYGMKRSGSDTNRNDHDHPPESKRIKTEKPDVKSEFNDDKK